jgi:hypothetical protein
MSTTTINVNNVNNHGTLGAELNVTDNTLRVAAGSGQRFATHPGTHYYLTLRDGNAIERVRVTNRAGDVLSIQRAQDGTSERRWPKNTCISVEWSPAQLCEFMAECGAGTPAPSVNAGTYCLTSCTCVTIDGAGRITNITAPINCA